MPTITLLTDFGLKDGNVGVMKGVIWGIAPNAKIADLSHFISPQDILEASLVLRRSAPYFPAGSVHTVVVDPGVGTSRRPIAGRLGDHYFVGPDNGVVTLLLERVEKETGRIEFVHLNQPRYWLPNISHVFHGRDIFAPCAAHLSAGAALEELGIPIRDIIRLDFPQPKPASSGYQAQVIHIDHFGNISTNILEEQLEGMMVKNIRYKEVVIQGLVRTFGERVPGELVALFGSTGSLIICVVNGNAAQRLDARVGDLLDIELEK